MAAGENSVQYCENAQIRRIEGTSHWVQQVRHFLNFERSYILTFRNRRRNVTRSCGSFSANRIYSENFNCVSARDF
jgi:hypothetical protein